jgi:PKD repeat protein
MKFKTLRLILIVVSFTFFSIIAQAQMTSPGVALVDNLNNINYSKSGSLGKKAAGSNKQCGQDTLDYARYKASQLVAINMSDGYRLGQYFDAPGDVTVGGFDFYAWQTMGTSHVVEVYCQLYEAGADSLPYGNALRSDTLYIDSTFGTGTLSGIAFRASWKPYTIDKAYILTVTSRDSNRVGVVCNSYNNGDGAGENLGCGSIGGRWYNFLDLNIGGTTLDCDVALEPHVTYKVYNDFDFKDCYKYQDTVKFSNESSTFYSNAQYNRYTFYGLEQYCHRWNYISTLNYNSIDGAWKYNSPTNFDVRLISTIYGYRGGFSCIDTAIKSLSFQPDEVQLFGDSKICSGNTATVDVKGSGNIQWFTESNDSVPFLIAPSYTTKTLYENDTVRVNAVNNGCTTVLTKRHIVEVSTAPTSLTVLNDSICLNSVANLLATPDVGTVRWYEDSISLTPVYIGKVHKIGPLVRDTSFFAQAQNGNCVLPGRTRATAFVSNDFAPAEPIVSNDTTLCLLESSITVNATSANTLRWFTVAAGGSSVASGTSYVFTPKTRGSQAVYVDAFDGKCASSRLPIKIDVYHFDKLLNLKDVSVCEGDSLVFDHSYLTGDLNWYTDKDASTIDHTGSLRTFKVVGKSDTFFLQPFEGACTDTSLHRFVLEAIPFGKFGTETMDKKACDGATPTLTTTADVGTIQWYAADKTTLLHMGTTFPSTPISKDRTYFLTINNRGCVTQQRKHDVKWLLMPEATFDYQLDWRTITLASRLIGQGKYVWTFGDGSDTLQGTDVKHPYSKDGDYTVTLIVTTPFGCADTFVREINLNTVGVATIHAAGIKVYPNPASSRLIIEHKVLGTNATVALMDPLGRTVERWRLDGEGTELNLQELALSGGLYTLLFQSNEQLTQVKLIIE